ncbi:MAG: isoamylase early set domain-containing protein [Nitrospira sp.]|nr:isoamylase early set domain-containing protein [Nitrospira sp.]MBS0155952.1 isoamylase early set domain-containing protein [Nitrospira sp.]MBS0166827.1 isoamylase early set domain-containing protein [Nitrospira sp.]MBX3325229.1 isoamylase early set domain-containing protein [Nitrospira sp.]
MTDPELLIQRFLDHDLTPEERVAFLRAVDADPALRRRWLNLEMVVAEAIRLPRFAPSPRFLSELQAKIAPSAMSWWERVWAAVTSTRTLEWNLAGAVAVACVAIATVVGLLSMRTERIVEVPVAMAPTQTIAAGMKQEPTVFVRLVLLQPGARSVSVAGDFNGWNPTHTPLERSDGGMWTATIPLKPGRYQYMFVIDGKQWIADPLATEAETDGFGAQNAVLDVDI